MSTNPFRLAASILLTAGAALAQHAGDVILFVEEGTIRTGAIESEGGVTTDERVFVGSFGESGVPGFTAEPGFDSLPETFEPGTMIGFDILEPLQRWTGAGFEAADDAMLAVSFLTLTVSTGPGFVPGFALAVQPNGGFHRHYNMTLSGDDGAAAPGVYLLMRALWSTDPLLGPSESFAFVMGHEAPGEEVEAAAGWLAASLGQPDCPADLDGSGAVDGADLGVLLGAWGTDAGDPDLDGNGVVDGADLGVLLASWGGTCP